ncbi:MAG: HEAT repeat domain-containing protein [Gemmataceae bacterium]
MADQFETWACNEEFEELTRLESARALADLGDRRSLDVLVGLMVEANSVQVRALSKVALGKLTGQKFSFDASARADVRNKQAKVWQQWIAANSKTAKLNYHLPSKSCLNGHTLVALCGVSKTTNKVIEYDEGMNESWSYESGYPTSAEKMQNGNVLIAELHKSRVFEVTPEKQIVRQYPVRHCSSARPLVNENFLVTGDARVKRQPARNQGDIYAAYEVNPDGKIVWELQIKGMEIHDAIRLENGNKLVLMSGTSRRSGYFVAEYDGAGKSV